MNAGRVQPEWPGTRLRSCVALGVVALLLFGVASAHCGLPRFALGATNGTTTVSHRWMTSPARASAVAVAHLPRYDSSKSVCPTKLLSASPPESAGASGALAAMTVAFGALIGAPASLVAPAVRGPPARLRPPLSGQARLTRLCVSRR